MLDGYMREINYLRVSVTDRCNLRCIYCMPPDGIEMARHEDILSLEEIEQVIRAAADIGVRKIRFTGGEPLVRKGLVELVERTAAIPTIDDIALTTNGVFLPQYGEALKEAGLNRVNISLDTLREDRFQKITRLGQLADVWKGINTALRLGLNPIKINNVIMLGINDDEVLDFVRLTTEQPLHVRFIELMPIGSNNTWTEGRYISNDQVRNTIIKFFGELQEEKKVAGNGPARYYRLPGAPGTIGFISAISSHFCNQCNRLRLTSMGTLRSCLYSEQEVDLKVPLRQGAGRKELRQLIARAVKLKPEKHKMNEGWQDKERVMFQIGG
ncbi:GTP 3',8-cyclase MoaA [Desulfolucanica intricata]|uniref:GTP 3',8-cyclase MoaA n=1 Tax=Desulfolucanica intricata TaxID=1285191 RepID=UPI00082DEC21|nr:GTP 3',8-cyclase MoaA [Desulfolucanica intricata]